jgi:hypothetical protein
MKMSIEGNEANIKIVGKRFSDLSDLHNLLVERKKVRPFETYTSWASRDSPPHTPWFNLHPPLFWRV